jgi:hypothetical protein
MNMHQRGGLHLCRALFSASRNARPPHSTPQAKPRTCVELAVHEPVPVCTGEGTAGSEREIDCPLCDASETSKRFSPKQDASRMLCPLQP